MADGAAPAQSPPPAWLDRWRRRAARWNRPWLGAAISGLLLIAILATADRVAVFDALRAVRPWQLAAALGLLALRDLVASVGCWHATMGMLGQRVPPRGLLRITVEVTPARFLLPLKTGEAAYVALTHRRHGVPWTAAALSRLLPLGWHLGALAALAALTAGPWIGGPVAGVAAAAVAGATLAVAIGFTRGRRYGSAVAAIGWAALAMACQLALYALALRAVTGAWPEAEAFAVIAGVVLACALPLSSRGVGVRELALLGGAALVSDATHAAVLGAGLIVSGLEVGSVTLLAATAAALAVRGARQGGASGDAPGRRPSGPDRG